MPFSGVLVHSKLNENFSIDCFDNQIVIRLVCKLQRECLLECFAHALWNHLDEFIHILIIKALLEEVYELIIGIGKLFFEIGPGESVAIEQEHDDVQRTLNII